MKENRNHKRVKAAGKIEGRVILASEIEIVDLSISGIRFISKKRITTNSFHSVVLTYNNEDIRIRGKIVRSTFKGINKDFDENIPVYEIAMNFTGLLDDDISLLNGLIESLNKTE